MVLISSFAYYIVPGYLFQSITALSFVCWIWKDSVTAQQIGSGLHGLGVGSFAFDWSTVAGFLGSPLATPGFAIINILFGYIIILYIIIPISYWTNSYNAKHFPIFSSHVFDANGKPYDVSTVLNETTFEFNRAGYDGYSKVNLSIFFVYTYGLSFAILAATLTHVALFHGRYLPTDLIFFFNMMLIDLLHLINRSLFVCLSCPCVCREIWYQTKETLKDKYADVHTRIMKRNYEAVPQWWFHIILIVVTGLALLTCEGFGRQLQLPYWGVLLAIGLAFIFTLPIGVITATTNQVRMISAEEIPNLLLFFVLNRCWNRFAATGTQRYH